MRRLSYAVLAGCLFLLLPRNVVAAPPATPPPALAAYLGSAKVIPEMVGVWDLSPDNKFLPYKKTLTIEPDAAYTIVMQKDGSTTRGRVKGGRRQMMMYDENRDMHTMYYEFVERDVMRIVDLDGTKYEARRRQ